MAAAATVALLLLSSHSNFTGQVLPSPLASLHPLTHAALVPPTHTHKQPRHPPPPPPPPLLPFGNSRVENFTLPPLMEAAAHVFPEPPLLLSALPVSVRRYTQSVIIGESDTGATGALLPFFPS
jgi:hypothetical protein